MTNTYSVMSGMSTEKCQGEQRKNSASEVSCHAFDQIGKRKTETRCSGMNLRSHRCLFLNTARAVHCFVHHRITFVGNVGWTGDSHVKLIGGLDVDSGNTF